MTAEVLEGLPFATYLDLDLESATGLKAIMVSPLLYAWRKGNGRPDKDELRVGRAVHTAIFEPHRFETEYVEWLGKVRRGKEWDSFCEEHAGQTILTRAQLANAQRIAGAVRAHPVASALLAEPGKAELSITWKHERTGLRCKSRIDWLCSSLVDLKTCRDPSPHMFGGQTARLGYHLQMAFYSAALSSLGMVLPAKIIAAQNVAPFDVVIYDVPESVIVVGEQLYESALDKVAACTRSGSWPGIAPDAELVLKLPTWAVPHFDDELDMEEDGWSVSIAREA